MKSARETAAATKAALLLAFIARPRTAIAPKCILTRVLAMRVLHAGFRFYAGCVDTQSRRFGQAMPRFVFAALLFLFAQAAAERGVSGPSSAPLRLRSGVELAPIFAREVKPRLNLPEEERGVYAGFLEAALTRADLVLATAQYILLVDRSPKVQAALLYWRDVEGRLHFIGASPASTGRRGGYEHFLTPLGVFEHTIAHLDFRAEGTRNEFGIRGYGVKGMRVFDFGWVIGERTWGAGGLSPMRLQVHATDPRCP